MVKTENETESQEQLAEKKRPSTHFSETDLHEEWKKFLAELRQNDPIIFNAISSFQLHKKGENNIVISYPSESARVEFEKVRTDFLNPFMHKVNHFNIVVEYTADVSLKKEIMTKRKIFDKFAEINPVLQDLNEAFKLDLS